ncbi:MINDY deubiquitinase domain-containing protein [Hirsutella rhossiliensis]|uniref:MINDY deubiquitinase domain-containing protein n=1 Tax=Hirsutella rhossiliensis TaxID=111463 RepID=A0A9P8N249_9HYPO|nr:MINDY deubiquitinase domain-containing protein [Hirsutella rhossiliensis]KAH0966253.1 MINDY deubiquitinase domain-containing protein [Hirsutella rhossiliensis]
MAAQELPGDEQPASAPRPPPDAHKQPLGDELSESVWEDAASRKKMAAAPASGQKGVPAALRPGQAPLNFGDEDDSNVWDEARQQSNDIDKLGQAPNAFKTGDNKSQTNPFLKRKPVPHRNDAVPVDSFARLDLDEAGQGSNPWQAPGVAHNAPPPKIQKSLLDDAESDPWASNQVPTPPAKVPAAAASPALMSLPSEDEPTWEDDPRPDHDKALPEAPPATAISDELIEDQNVWDDLGALDRGKAKVLDLPPEQQAQLDDWNLIDADPSSSPPKPPADEEAERPIDAKSETYQVKNIRWHDDTSMSNPRTSPILIQNKNGPCPLVALVNALTLTTPADMPDTALVQVLRSREQVSLNLLLDAVFDELMSPRRTNSEDALPDVSDLYSFLQSLHTGMNVNPRFVPTPEMMTAYKRTSLTHLDAAERGDFIPGTFENTMEMSLYATFSIPLIHGWLPSRSDPAYEALERRGASYEEVQNLLFHEEELEGKLSNPNGELSETEAQLYQDIMTIKMFLEESATQLTPWGIGVIAKAMRPGTFAILFRNDHFSTLYCHPRATKLLSLVTDAGYGSHEEVVWESLVDVNGERTEYLSGDFRVVGAAPAGSAGGGGTSSGGGEWTAMQCKRGKGREQEEQGPTSPKHEQEDRDLALALQLQEEEEHRHREEQARRRRESILSEQYIEQQAQRPTPVVRNSRRATSSGSAGPEPGSSNGIGLGIGMAGSPLTRQPSEPSRQPQQSPGKQPGGAEDEQRRQGSGAA